MECSDEKNSRPHSNSVGMWVMIDLRYLLQGQAEAKSVYVPCICHSCFGGLSTKLYGRRHNTFLLDLSMLRESRHSINTYLWRSSWHLYVCDHCHLKSSRKYGQPEWRQSALPNDSVPTDKKDSLWERGGPGWQMHLTSLSGKLIWTTCRLYSSLIDFLKFVCYVFIRLLRFRAKLL